MRIVFVGAGNVATHLAKKIDESQDVVQVYSYHYENAYALAKTLKNAQPINDLAQLVSDADVYILSVKDDVLADISDKINFTSGLWLHTSGSVSIELLKKRFPKCGVLYPLQTFSKGVEVDVSEVPLFIEGCNDSTHNEIEQLAKMLSGKVFVADSCKRKILHIAAVFGCNFVNHLWCQADEILKEVGYDFEILLPLIDTTLNKAKMVSPYEGQTGPARRGDLHIIEAHEQMLNSNQVELYRLLSRCIMSKYKVNNE